MVSKEGGYTIDYETSEIVSIFEKAEKFKKLDKPLLIFAGENFGIGEKREWAVKSIKLLGVKAIIAKSFDEEYRKSLLYYGVLPLEFIEDDIDSLKLKGDENISILADKIKVDGKVKAYINRGFDEVVVKLKIRIDTQEEVEYYKKGGVLPFLLNS